MSKFTFVSGITSDQKAKLYERHSFAYYRASLSSHLSATERSNVRALYRQAISHDINTQAGVNASAIVEGRQIWVNFGVLFPQSDTEIAQALLHEMIHCAGYTNPSKSGTPGNNGPYFGSAPLRAELTITGMQSDESLVAAQGIAADGAPASICSVIDQ